RSGVAAWRPWTLQRGERLPARADRRRTHGAPRTSSRPPRPASPAAKGARPGARTGHRGWRAAGREGGALDDRAVPRREPSPCRPGTVAQVPLTRRTKEVTGGVLTYCGDAG